MPNKKIIFFLTEIVSRFYAREKGGQPALDKGFFVRILFRLTVVHTIIRPGESKLTYDTLRQNRKIALELLAIFPELHIIAHV